MPSYDLIEARRMNMTITDTRASVYGAYGERNGSSDRSHSAFAGEVLEAGAGWYMLGERAYSPALRRFIAPDGASPFDGGGVNRYAYCGGDPVNRIDPSGHTWLGWAGASLGLKAPSGATRGMSPASRIQETASTPVTVATTAAPVMDTVSITSAIDSVGRTTADRPEADRLFGWMAAKTDSGGTSLPAVRNGTSTERFLGQQQDVSRAVSFGVRPPRQVQVVTNWQIPAKRLRFDRFGQLNLVRKWTPGTHRQNPNSMIFAADTTITQSFVPNVFHLLNTHGFTKANVYTGAHGEPYGRNWHLRTGERLNTEPKFFLEDFVLTKKAAKATGKTINAVNMAFLTKQQMQHHLLKDGAHIIGCCFGLADEVVMDALNLQQVVVYDLF
jgi:RHS repeat-associated protein